MPRSLWRRLKGSGVTANCLHPGVVASHLLPRWLQLVKPLFSRQMLDEERGARTSLYLALSGEVAGANGLYYDENQLPQPAAPAANNVPAQEALWPPASAGLGWPLPGESANPGALRIVQRQERRPRRDAPLRDRDLV